MSCVENMIPNADSEMEEGEIVDDIDYLSDISSEEEFLLRQRLQVLENYNTVLERKKAKICNSESGKKSREDALSLDLSEISDTEINYPQIEANRCNKAKPSNVHKQKRRKVTEVFSKSKDHKRKSHKVKKKNSIKILNESSEESEDEYRNKRRKLANAVSVTTEKNDTSSLKARLKKMLCGTQIQKSIKTDTEEIKTDSIVDSLNWCIDALGNSNNSDLKKSDLPNEDLDLEAEIYELIDLCGDDDDTKKLNDVQPEDCVDSVCNDSKKVEDNVNAQDSDEDLEILRQNALETKTSKAKSKQINTERKLATLSEEEDSDTAELRAICLKSALLKKAIEMKRKQKLRKRLSQSLQDEYILENNNYANKIETDNNTDIESVDMDIGSDGDEKVKETCYNIEKGLEIKNHSNMLEQESHISKNMASSEQIKEDEIEEDEDLLRAKLLTSLSKNLPNLVSPSVLNSISDVQNPSNISLDAKINKTISVPEQKPFIIKLGGSDSEGEHEATKNLTKMHMKWSEQVDFQQKLDMFLKSTRMEVEKKEIPDYIQKPPEEEKSTPKFVAKTVKHLPKPEQIEYKNLVKRMEELEKIKKARQSAMNSNKLSIQAKETLKPRNITIETTNNINNVEQQIAMSRKKIAEESAKMLRLKEEGIKLSQKHKIVATELRNITTAITLNKKEQRLLQNRLSKIRHQHQLLLNSSPSLKHSNNNLQNLNHINGKNLTTAKLQKENNPVKDEYRNPLLLKSVKVSVVNDFKEDSLPNSRLSVEVDVCSNKKIVKIPNSPAKDRDVDTPSLNVNENIQIFSSNDPVAEKGGGSVPNNGMGDTNSHEGQMISNEVDDYKSPLESLQADTCVEDPNTFLCPFEVGGTCRDPDCKHLHPKIPSNQ